MTITTTHQRIQSPSAIWHLLKTTAKEWSEDEAPRLGASLAYYAVFSLAPLLVIVVSIDKPRLGVDV